MYQQNVVTSGLNKYIIHMNKFLLIITLILISSFFSFAQQADDIIGKYHLPNKLDVEIFKNEGKYSGKIIALNGYEDGQTTDIKNPDHSKSKTPLIGMVLIKGLEYDQEEKEWINGSMYGPEKGVFFNLRIKEIRQKEIEVVASKYFFWKTLEWKKI